MSRILATITLAASVSLLSCNPAFSEIRTYTAILNGASEVPPTGSMGLGTADVSINTDTKKITWAVKYDGLSGQPVAAHFHGPAGLGQSAGPAIDISANIATGTADITESQMSDFDAGKMYLNIHTEKFPDLGGRVEPGHGEVIGSV